MKNNIGRKPLSTMSLIMLRLLSAILLLLSIKANSQIKNNLYIIPEYSRGNFIHSHEVVPLLADKAVNIFALNINRQTKGYKEWEQLYKLPLLGGGIAFIDFGEPQKLGKAMAVYGSFASWNNKHLIRWGWRINAGLAFCSKYYDPETNNTNILIGSRKNLYFNLAYMFEMPINKRLFWQLGASFIHLSNGKTALPNLGYNMLVMNTALRYKFNKEFEADKPKIKSTFKKKKSFGIMAAAGAKALYDYSKARYAIASLSLNYAWHLKPKFRFGTGIDLFYDETNPKKLEKKGEKIKNKDFLRSGAHIGQCLVIGNVDLYLQEGLYIGYTDNVSDYKMYNRAGIRWISKNNIIVGISVKSHLLKADFVEWGIGYKIRTSLN